MLRCCVCGEWIDDERGDDFIFDECSGDPAHLDCLESLDGFEIEYIDDIY